MQWNMKVKIFRANFVSQVMKELVRVHCKQYRVDERARRKLKRLQFGDYMLTRVINTFHKHLGQAFQSTLFTKQRLELNSCTLSVTKKIYTSEKMSGKTVDYAGLLQAQKDDKILIIDVRENSEIQETGKLPGSIHIPVKEVLNELKLSNEAFERKYGKKKPSLDTPIITSCKLGGRSARVQSELQNAGYKNVINYSGGWADWEKHQRK